VTTILGLLTYSSC